MGTNADAAVISDVAPGSPAERAGLSIGDRIISVNGVQPRDVLEWRRLSTEASLALVIERSGRHRDVACQLNGEPLGLAIDSAVFDRVHTCDNHCEFCFIYQLPKGLRKTLYLKDDDYRLSFLFGNFTTLTRFTEVDLERVVDERLSPIHVSIHSADPWLRSEMLRNPRGGMSLRWAKQILKNGINVKMQIVLCPGVNDAAALDSTLCGILENFPDVSEVAVVPLGLSRFNPEARLRVSTPEESRRLVEQVDFWRDRFRRILGRPVVHVGDEVFLNAGIPVPPAHYYGEFGMLEDGIGLVRNFIDSFRGRRSHSTAHESFFGAVDVSNPSSYLSRRNPARDTGLRPDARVVKVSLNRRRSWARAVILTGEMFAPILSDLLEESGVGPDVVEVRPVPNRFFGGNTGVSGLMTFSDVLDHVEPRGTNSLNLLPSACLNEGRFLDGPTVDDLTEIADVEVLEATGDALRQRLDDLRLLGVR